MKYLLLPFLLLSFYSSFSQVNLTQGLVMYLPFNGNANDASGNGNNGTVNGATLTTDQSGNPNSAYKFNGNGDFIQVLNNANMASATSTVVLKFKIDTFNQGACFGNALLTKGTTAGFVNNFYQLDINPNSLYPSYSCAHPYLATDQRLEGIVNSSLPTQANVSNGPVIDSVNWHCVVAKKDSNNLYLYLDGSLVYSVASTLFSATNTEDIYIGKSNNALSPFYVNGKIDEVRLYNRAINSQEVTAVCALSCDTLANFTNTTNGCNVVHFTDSSYASCDTINTYLWDFGDGITSTLKNPNHVYTTVGTFNVTLKIYQNSTFLDSVVKSVTISNLGAVATINNDTTICKNTPIALTASGGTMYTWFGTTTGLSATNIANPTATTNITRTYKVAVSDVSSACADTAQVIISIFNDVLNITGPNRICTGDSATLNSTGGVSNFSWTPTTDITSTTTASTQAYPTADTWYHLNATTINGCNYVDSFWVRHYVAPRFSIKDSLVSCGRIRFSRIDSSATGFTTWNWNFGDGGTGFGNTTLHTYANSGTYTVTLTANYGNGCIKVDTTTVIIDKSVDAQISSDTTICPNASATLSITGTNLTNYTWIDPNSSLSSTNTSTTNASPTSLTTYTVYVTNNLFCLDTLDVSVDVHNDAFTLSGDSFICEGGNTTLTMSNSNYSTISWNPTGIMQSQNTTSNVVTPLASTNVTVNAVSNNGCNVSASKYIQVNPNPVFSIGANGTVCKNTPMQLYVTGGNTYTWTPQIGLNRYTVADPIFNYPTSVTYNVHVSGGCIDSNLSYTVQVSNENAVIQAYASDSLLDCLAALPTLYATGGSSYSWTPAEYVLSPNNAKTKVNLNEDGMYYVHISDYNGCAYDDTVSIKYKNGFKRFEMPNAFTPNNGTTNNIFKVMSAFSFDMISFQIFDRWGTLVYTTSDINSGWDGMYKNEKAAQDNYIWVIKGNTPCGEFTETGNVLVLW